MPSYLENWTRFKNKYRNASREVCEFSLADINLTIAIWRDDNSINSQEYISKLDAERDAINERLMKIEKQKPKKLLSQSVCFDSGSYIGYSDAQLELIRVGFEHALNQVYRLEKPNSFTGPIDDEG